MLRHLSLLSVVLGLACGSTNTNPDEPLPDASLGGGGGGGGSGGGCAGAGSCESCCSADATPNAAAVYPFAMNCCTGVTPGCETWCDGGCPPGPALDECFEKGCPDPGCADLRACMATCK